MNYEMGGTILSKTVKEKDLGVTMNANMKVSEQCRIAGSKAGSSKLFGTWAKMLSAIFNRAKSCKHGKHTVYRPT